MSKNVIANWIAKQLFKKGGAIANNKSVNFSTDALIKRLSNYNIKPDDIISEDQLLRVLSSVKQAESNVFNNKFKSFTADVLPFKFKKSFAEEVDSMIKKGEVNVGTADKTPPYKPSKSQTDFEIQERYRADNAKAIKRFEEKMKKDKPDDMATGGRAGFYQGGQTQMETNLSDIGHGSDALMSRNMLIAPGSQATTSTGLNYLLGEDNDTFRVPYSEGKNFNEYLKDREIKDKKMYREQLLREYKEDIRRKKVMDSKQRAAEGGRIGYKNGLEVKVPPSKPYTTEMFKDDSMIFLKGMYGTGKQSNPMFYNEMIKKGNKLREQGVERETIIEIIKNNKDKIDMILKQQTGDIKSFAEGGPARQNFGMGKRAFLKLMGSGVAGIAGLKTGLLGFGKKEVAKSVIAPATQAANEAAPAYFLKLVAKIKKLGDNVTETGALAERQNVKQYKDYTLTEDTATGRIEIQKVKTDVGEELGKDNFGNGLTEEVYMGYTQPETIIVKGKPVKTKPEYEEGTAYLRNDGPQTGDVYEEVPGVTDEVLKEVGEAVVKKADGGRIGYKLGKKVVETVIKKAGEGKFTKNEVLLNMFQNTIKATKDANTKTRFTNFIEEIKLKPELSKDPQVWNFFTKGLPKNQKLVVYGDDTVDFWTQSDFGPHNIAKSAKFQKKHPYLTKDQAVKIQNMEPEDQIFEMKRLEAIRKRTANASGGRIGFSTGKGIMAIVKNLLKPKAKLNYLEKYPRIDIKELMKSDKPIKLYSGVGDRQGNTLKAYKETAKDFNTTVDKVKKDNFKGQWWTPFKEYASSFGNPRNINSKMLTTELTPKEIKMALRYVEKINKKEKMISRMKMEKINNPPKYNLTTNENTVIIPKIKLKKLKEAGKIDTDYMILDKMKNKLGLSEGGIAGMLGE